MIFKLKISKETRKRIQLKKGEYLIVKSLKGEDLVLAKPEEAPLKERSILDVVGIGESGLTNISSHHEAYLYPSRTKS